jgi:hypothetical protein
MRVDSNPIRMSVNGRQETGPKQDDVACWMRGDFNEMSDLRLTVEQAAKFWSVPLELARVTLSVLTESGFLRRHQNVYRR